MSDDAEIGGMVVSGTRLTTVSSMTAGGGKPPPEPAAKPIVDMESAAETESAINVTIEMHTAADVEAFAEAMEATTSLSPQDIVPSPEVIDQASMRYMGEWRRDHAAREGLFTWLQRLGTEALVDGATMYLQEAEGVTCRRHPTKPLAIRFLIGGGKAVMLGIEPL